jgi:putative protease
MTMPTISLPLLSVARAWEGLSAAGALVEPATASPEPDAPQGEYAPADIAVSVPLVSTETSARPVELLAPAGGPDAAFAAFHYGADAIYLGLKKFSARAEAENFSLKELAEITAYAHSLTPCRRVFVTVNTLVRQDELAELIDDLAALSDIGVDALIIQDLGVYRAVRQFFPALELHASTQLAVHNQAGAVALKRLGFTRVVLARELTFEEVHDITATSTLETEVFIHGALCYSYSGLCLFSSQTLGRSGNRGKCAYSCRDSYEVHDAPATLRDGSRTRRDPSTGFPFSMKDLALPDHLPALRAAGVSCFKVEGRKKSPLYVATTTDYYRKLIDGGMTDAEERTQHEADMQAVFSRPWTRLFVQSHRDKEVADRDTVGHRGTLIGHVESVRHPHTATARVRFRTGRALERHDGLQIDLPVLGKPFGFPVDHLWVVASGRHGKTSDVIQAPAGSLVDVGLPADHPALPAGAPVYCSSSQDVKRRYRHSRPKPGLYRHRRPIRVTVILREDELVVTGSAKDAEVRRTLSGPFPPARDITAMAEAARVAFEKWGDTELELESFTFENPDGRFVPISRLNQVRRELAEALSAALREMHNRRVQEVQSLVGWVESSRPTVEYRTQAMGLEDSTHPTKRHAEPFRWSLKIDRLSFIDAFDAADWDSLEELVVDIARDHPTVLAERLDRLRDQLGDRIRLALPPLTRKWEETGLRHKIDRLRAAGWSKWEAANLSAWTFLEPTAGLDLATDWSVYVVNRLAAHQLLDMGVTRFALSPEDGLVNLRSLLGEFGATAVLIVYQDTPQFLAESCAYANLIGGCPGKANCRFESMEMVSSHGERVTALDYHCRTIVLNDGPFCLSPRLADVAAAGAVSLRADFVYRPYDPSIVRERWRLVRAGRPVPGGHAANFDRGLL